MAKCTNCGNNMTCGCQKRTASDGKACCSHCLNAYEAQVRARKEKEKGPQGVNVSNVQVHVTQNKV